MCISKHNGNADEQDFIWPASSQNCSQYGIDSSAGIAQNQHSASSVHSCQFSVLWGLQQVGHILDPSVARRALNGTVRELRHAVPLEIGGVLVVASGHTNSQHPQSGVWRQVAPERQIVYLVSSGVWPPLWPTPTLASTPVKVCCRHTAIQPSSHSAIQTSSHSGGVLFCGCQANRIQLDPCGFGRPKSDDIICHGTRWFLEELSRV